MSTTIGPITIEHPTLDQEQAARETIVEDVCKRFCDWLAAQGLLWCFYPPASDRLRPVPYPWFHRVAVEHQGPGGSQELGAFLDAALNDEGWSICRPVKDEQWDVTVYEFQHSDVKYWLYRYYGIDQRQAEREREALLAAVRQDQRATKES